jgi:hypothetical protein
MPEYLPRVVINADDPGCSSEVNEAIQHALHHVHAVAWLFR